MFNAKDKRFKLMKGNKMFTSYPTSERKERSALLHLMIVKKRL